jgi:hypothetical protein
MTFMQKTTNFVKQLTARLKQDQDTVVVLKNQRKADSAINSQLAALESRVVDLEETVENRTEALNDAKYPTTLITDNKRYVDNIVRAKEALDNAQSELDSAKESIVFFKQLQKENNEEVSVEA